MAEWMDDALYVVLSLFVVTLIYTLFRIKVISSLVYIYLTANDADAKVAMAKIVIQALRVLCAIISLCALYEVGAHLYRGENIFLKLLK